MSTSISVCHSIVLHSGPADGAGPAAGASLVHILWLSEPALVDAARLGSELDARARPPAERGFSSSFGSLAGAPSAAIHIHAASASELHSAAERAKQLFPGCLSMAFDAHPGFDLEETVAGTLLAMGLAPSHDAPARPAGKAP